MVDHPDDVMIEFSQTYEDGKSVLKRGVPASPMVVRKYEMADDEVMSFTTWRGHHKAMTVFHFHPAFPADRREDYMWGHEEGWELLDDYYEKLGEQRRADWRARTYRASQWAKHAGATVNTLIAAFVVALLHGQVR